jgi:hypothetical protein
MDKIASKEGKIDLVDETVIELYKMNYLLVLIE